MSRMIRSRSGTVRLSGFHPKAQTRTPLRRGLSFVESGSRVGGRTDSSSMCCENGTWLGQGRQCFPRPCIRTPPGLFPMPSAGCCLEPKWLWASPQKETQHRAEGLSGSRRGGGRIALSFREEPLPRVALIGFFDCPKERHGGGQSGANAKNLRGRAKLR